MTQWIVLSCALGYLLGSIPFGLVIGKVFFQTDIRTAGSKNLGGSNAGRVLGAKACVAVMTLDIMKVIIAMGLASLLPGGEGGMIAAGLCAALGHCYPVFAGFRGGKAVATTYGFFFGMMVFGGYSPWIFFLPLLAFLAILYVTKIVALASIGSVLLATLYQWLCAGFSGIVCAMLLFDALVIWRHRKNLHRVASHQENKIKWM